MIDGKGIFVCNPASNFKEDLLTFDMYLMTSPIIPRLLYQDVSVVPAPCLLPGAVSVYVTGPFQDGDCLGPNQTWAISNHLT